MGLLDDAIREHLDLKRRRGADPAEVERAEREALGPVRRSPEDLAPEGYVPEAEALAPESHEPWHEGDIGAPAAGAIELEPTDDEPLEEFEPYDAPPAPEAAAPAPAPPAPIAADEAPTGEHRDDQATVEYHVDEPAAPAGEDDVLEETPEFLQDAPEHDRLWFEQRPPRDFDFNE